MKKIASLGLVVLLTMSVGCSKKEEEFVPTATVSSDVEAQTVSTETIATEEAPVLELSNEDFEPFFRALFAYSEEQYTKFNENPDITYTGYFDNLKNYKDNITSGIGKFLSNDLNKKLGSESNKLDFDLPKKVLINEYIVEASGKVEKVEIQSSREIGEHMMYEVAVTTTNKIEPTSEFVKNYGWSEELGYYELKSSGIAVTDLELEEQKPTYVYTQHENVSDAMKIVSRYWVEVSPSKSGPYTYYVEGLKQAGTFDVNIDLKQLVNNTQYVERVPYYEEVTDAQKKQIIKVLSKLMNSPKETYYYYEKAYKGSFALLQNFWSSLNLGEDMMIGEETYKQAFDSSINPYKDNIVGITINDKKIDIVTSIYSTQLQPTFIVTLPIETLLKDNSLVYYNYKYMVCTEDNKIEAIQFIKMDEITQAEYEGEELAEESVTTEATLADDGTPKETAQ